MSPTHDFNNSSDQQERRRVERDTYLSRAQADADLEAQGRFKKQSPTRVTGVPVYPAQPPTSPFAGDPVGDEPPLGQDVNWQEPIGTEKEIQASLSTPNSERSSASPSIDRVGTSGRPLATLGGRPLVSFVRRV